MTDYTDAVAILAKQYADEEEADRKAKPNKHKSWGGMRRVNYHSPHQRIGWMVDTWAREHGLDLTVDFRDDMIMEIREVAKAFTDLMKDIR